MKESQPTSHTDAFAPGPNSTDARVVRDYRKAPEGWRTPKPGGLPRATNSREASWSAVARYRFSPTRIFKRLSAATFAFKICTLILSRTLEIATDYEKCFRMLHSLPVDLFLGAHASYYEREKKHARQRAGAPNPFIDPEG